MARRIGPIQSLYEDMIRRYSGDGPGLQTAFADIEAGKQRAISTGTQQAISGGLFGTTIMPTITTAAEEVAGRQKLAARGQQEERLTRIQQAYANMIQRSREAARPGQQTAARRPSVSERLFGQSPREALYGLSKPYMTPAAAPAAPGRTMTARQFPALFKPTPAPAPQFGKVYTPTGQGLYTGGSTFLRPEQVQWS